MGAKKVQYKDFVKVEFKDALTKIYERPVVHMYSVNLACSKAVQVGFDYEYDILDDEHISKTINLGEFGRVVLVIDIMNNSATVSKKSIPVLRNFLENYEVDSDVPSYNIH